jgi:surface antigen
MTARGLAIAVIALQLGGCAMLGDDQAALYSPLDDRDVTLAANTLQQALEQAPDGTSKTWRNEATGNSGSITPTHTYLSAGGHYCRDYVEDLVHHDGKGRFHYTACRDETAHWTWL